MPRFSLLSEELRRRDLDVTGVENALLDLLVRVEAGDPERIGLVEGTMRLVGHEEQLAIRNWSTQVRLSARRLRSIQQRQRRVQRDLNRELREGREAMARQLRRTRATREARRS